MTYISIYDITIWVEDEEGNGKLYTTKSDYDHSFFASLIGMEDLVPIEEEE
jgi:hypothetical protein